MFQRFTDRARRAVVLAQEEARMLNHDYIGTEHILLGVLHEGEGAGARALHKLGVSLEDARGLVHELIGRGRAVPMAHIPFTPRAKKVLELSAREAQELGQGDVGTEHLVLGLLREGDGVGARVLHKLGGDSERVRQTVVAMLEPWALDDGAIETDAGPRTARCPGCLRPVERNLASRMVDVPSEEEGEAIRIRLIYCTACGHVLGTARA